MAMTSIQFTFTRNTIDQSTVWGADSSKVLVFIVILNTTFFHSTYFYWTKFLHIFKCEWKVALLRQVCNFFLIIYFKSGYQIHF